VPGERVQIVREDFVFTEAPVGTADEGLLFSDLRASRIYRLDASGVISLFRDQTNDTNGLALARNGDLLAAETGAKRISISSAGGPIRELTRGDGATPLTAVNDLIVDDKGGVYFTDSAPGPLVPGRKVYVYYLPPGATQAFVVDDTIVRPNGLTLTLDGKRLLVDDTVGPIVFAFDVQPDGTLKNKRPFIRLRGISEGKDSGADGMAIDRDGRIYVTSVPGVQVFDKSGDHLGTIPIPRQPTNVAFAGMDKRTLYITAREGLYRVRTLTRGPARLGK
jgi:gluconolactonase